jgi:hypothetical protein
MSDEGKDRRERAGLLDRQRRKAPTEIDHQTCVQASFDIREDDAEINVGAAIAKRRDVRERQLNAGVAVNEAGKAIPDEVKRVADCDVKRGFGKRSAFTYVMATAAAGATAISGSAAESLLDTTGARRSKNAGRGHRGLVETIDGNNALRHSHPHNQTNGCCRLLAADTPR